MMGKTHLAGGLAAGLVLERVTAMAGMPIIPPSLAVQIAGVTIPASILAFIAVGLGSLLPDLDEPNSLASNLPRAGRGAVRQTLKKSGVEGVLRFVIELALTLLNTATRTLSTLVRLAAMGHRAATHWLATCFVAGLLAALLGLIVSFPDLGFWLFLGCLSHLALDMMTISGLEVLRPFSGQTFHLLPPGLRIRTGSVVDMALNLVFSLVAGIFVYWSISQSIDLGGLLRKVMTLWPFWVV